MIATKDVIFLKNQDFHFTLLNQWCVYQSMGLPWWLSGKEYACQAGDASSIPALEKTLEKELATQLQYS